MSSLITVVVISASVVFTEGCQNVNDCIKPVYIEEIYDLNYNADFECGDECAIVDIFVVTAKLVYVCPRWLNSSLPVLFCNYNISDNLEYHQVKVTCAAEDCGLTRNCNFSEYFRPECLCDPNQGWCSSSTASTISSTTTTTPYSKTTSTPDSTTATTSDFWTSTPDSTTTTTPDFWTSTPDSTTATTSDFWTSTPDSTTTTPDSTIATPKPTGVCLDNEYQFNNHCYYIKTHNGSDFSVQETCSGYTFRGKGVAVSTEEEKYMVENMVGDFSFGKHNVTVLTSGIFQNGKSFWMDWGFDVNTRLLGIDEPIKCENDSGILIYPGCVNGSFILQNKGFNEYNWVVSAHLRPNRTNYVLCEREMNSFISADLEYDCQNLMNERNCSKGCCSKDEQGRMWGGCVGETIYKPCDGSGNVTWRCNYMGYFETEYPNYKNCSCKKCSTVYEDISYNSCINTTAIGGCPMYGSESGYSKWFCNADGEFEGSEPDLSTCCTRIISKRETEQIPCRNVDSFLNTWFACPGESAKKITECPLGKKENANVAWKCNINGTNFMGTPDYTECNCDQCQGTDKFGRFWEACEGTKATIECPNNSTGQAFWSCNNSPYFSTREPDFSNCSLQWISDVQNDIENNVDASDIMSRIGKETEEDSVTGINNIFEVTNETIQLFVQQSTTNVPDLDNFRKFTEKYSKVLKNFISNGDEWENFQEEKRQEYGQRIINLTEQVGFSWLSIKKDNIDEFMVDYCGKGNYYWFYYSKDGRNSSCNSTLSVKIESFDGMNNKVHAAVGVLFSNTNGSIMFPVRDKLHEGFNTPIVSFSVAQQDANNGFKKIKNVKTFITFKHVTATRTPKIIRRRQHSGEVPGFLLKSSVCKYFNPENSSWIDDGCTVYEVTKEETICSCSHLSTLSVLMEIQEYLPNTSLEITSLTVSSVSIVSLLLALIIFLGLRSIKGARNTIGIHLCLCLLVGHLLVSSVMDKTHFLMSKEICSLVGVIIHYVFLAAFTWMAVEGFHLYWLVNKVFRSSINYLRRYLIIGYVFPIVVICFTLAIAALLHEDAYGRDELCWLTTPGYVWAFIGPVAVISLLNLFVVVLALKAAIRLRAAKSKTFIENATTWLRGCFSLTAHLGVTWLLGLLTFDYNEEYNIVLVYCFVIINGLQGLFIFLFRCILNKEVRDSISKEYRSLWSTEISREKSEGNKQASKVDDTDRSISAETTKSSEIFVRVDCKLGGRSFEIMEEVNDPVRMRTFYRKKQTHNIKDPLQNQEKYSAQLEDAPPLYDDIIPLSDDHNVSIVAPCHFDDVYIAGFSWSPNKRRIPFPPVITTTPYVLTEDDLKKETEDKF